MEKKVKIEYAAMSSKFEITANNKFTAYCAMCYHYKSNNHMIAIYTDEFKEDSWLNIYGKVSERLDEIFEPVGDFDTYFENNIEEIKKAYYSIKQLI